MLKRVKYAFLMMVLWALVLKVQAQQQDTLKVLFVGNSYTYFWNLPQTVTSMAESQHKVIMARKSTEGGTTLKQHWEGDKNLKSRELIKGTSWDVVVIQNHSMSTINDYEEFIEYGQKFIDLVKETGATPLLYMTWAREFNPLMQEKISAGYRDLGARANVQVVPVGEVWAKARQLKPGFRLYDPDESHPSTIGTYLTALVFCQVLTGNKVTGIPHRLSTIDKNGEELFYSIMSKGDAAFMQQLVDSFDLDTYQADGK